LDLQDKEDFREIKAFPPGFFSLKRLEKNCLKVKKIA